MANATYQAPIARLPVELLSYVFLLGAHTPDADDAEVEEDGPESSSGGDRSAHDGKEDISPCISSSSTPPDVFAAVNRHWREVALGTPQLWSRLCVTIGDLTRSGEGGWFPKVSRYVSRSGRCPLDVYIDARDPEWDFSENDADVRPSEKEFRDIIGVCQSLKSLTICASGPRSPTSALSCSPESSGPPVALPQLRRLELGYDDVQAAALLLGAIDVTGVTHIALEDASSPERDETLDADILLTACTKATSAGSPNCGQPLFPRAQSVMLRRVEASAEAFEAFYGALPNLRELTVAQMFLLGAEALTFRNVDLTFVPPELPMSVRAFGALSAELEQRRTKPAPGEASCGILTHAFAAVSGPHGSERGSAMLW
ncbi:hypothetical protein TRAPUB_6261 [Trametes pubescens]|uniref:Uncharacterized protein n=1 Tax=Trametes pubescens TaxID=154538 RepID=A0A1M2V6E2_TRAPU|nr:hypothetical protein TRAPUB_6261 [Trametes pubescens]